MRERALSAMTKRLSRGRVGAGGTQRARGTIRIQYLAGCMTQDRGVHCLEVGRSGLVFATEVTAPKRGGVSRERASALSYDQAIASRACWSGGHAATTRHNPYTIFSVMYDARSRRPFS